LVVLGVGLSLEAQTWPRLVLDRAVSGIAQPIGLANAGDSSGRMFVLQQTGQVRIVRNGALVATPFLDIAAKVSCCSERGLLGIAFPPGFAASRRFYVNYTDRNGNTVVARYRVPQGTPDVADPTSEQISCRDAALREPTAGTSFGPDGFLHGAGGSGGDPEQRAEPRRALGKMLRIDVEGPFTQWHSSTNPACDDARCAAGGFRFRNPWRLFLRPRDRGPYIGDVGQNIYEEINFQAASSRGGETTAGRSWKASTVANAATCQMAGPITLSWNTAAVWAAR
jgi:glucose/arabinose dehydrogenase